MSTTSTPQYPKGLPYIVGNEASERFSYYGMRSILVIFLTKYVVDSMGNPDHLTADESKAWFHLFAMGVYLFPIIGAVISDAYWGKYRTILRLSVVYCLGHLCLAMFETRFGFICGLSLIAVGSGGIKPCVSAHVGDQFHKENQSLMDKAFAWFYFSINFGAFAGSLITPILLHNQGPWLAFGVPGVLMAIATFLFWLGRKKFVHVPPVGMAKIKEAILSPEGLKAVSSLAVLYIFVAFFWALYDQTGSSWVLQADAMNRNVDLRFGPFQASWLQFELYASQVQSINPILIMIFVPIFYNFVFPLTNRWIKVTPLRKMGVGFILTAVAFAIVAVAQAKIDAGQTPSMMWQLVAYLVITVAEVFISITALEFSYTQAPNAIKSIVMGIFFLSVSLGNFITAAVNIFIQNPDGSSKLTGAEYFWFFTGLVLVAGFLFMIVARFYQEKTHIQTTQEAID